MPVNTPAVPAPSGRAARPLPPAPTPLALPDLLTIVRRRAARFARDGFGTVLDEAVLARPERWFTRLHADPYLDVWLITWPSDTSTELHDHAGSLGALAVARGTLLEHRWTRAAEGPLRTRALPAGRSAAFPLGYVHDVVNAGPEPAVSVHAYSPPLSAMAYYAVDDRGRLRRTRTVLTDEPEER